LLAAVAVEPVETGTEVSTESSLLEELVIESLPFSGRLLVSEEMEVGIVVDCGRVVEVVSPDSGLRKLGTKSVRTVSLPRTD
jgi:hypothetical protein